MKSQVKGDNSCSYLDVHLEPGESVLAASDAMSSMAPDVEMKAMTNGGVWRALLRKLFGGGAFLISHFTNRSGGHRRTTFVSATPGQIRCLELGDDDSFCLQPGAFLAATDGVRLGLRWAGIVSWLAREGLFRLRVSGRGRVWYGAYGALVDKAVEGEYIVDTSHIVAYSPSIKLRVQRAGGLFGGESVVTRVVGKGTVIIQTRSLASVGEWVNPRLPQ